MQLFDLQDDPSEQRDVAARYPEQVARLLAAHAAMDAEPRPHPEQSSNRQNPNPTK
jgi:hypothetical protein